MQKIVVSLIFDQHEVAWFVKRKETNEVALVGGKVEDYETPHQAIVREIQEELGVTPNSTSLVGHFKNKTQEFTIFACYIANFEQLCNCNLDEINGVIECDFLDWHQEDWFNGEETVFLIARAIIGLNEKKAFELAQEATRAIWTKHKLHPSDNIDLEIQIPNGPLLTLPAVWDYDEGCEYVYRYGEKE